MDEEKIIYSGIGFIVIGLFGLISLKYKFFPHGNRRNSAVISLIALIAGTTMVIVWIVA